MDVYFISGLGADNRAFEKLVLPNRFTPHYLNWIPHRRGESLNDYAKRLAAAINTAQPYAIVGLSMGGMIASAMTQFLKPAKTILISSVGCAEEFPPLLKLARFTQVHRLLPTALFHKPNFIAHILFGAKSRNEKRIMNHLISHADARFVKWSIGAILSWKNRIRPHTLYHIHGEKDKILPLKFTKPDAVLKGGTHFIIWTKARQVSRLLVKALDEAAEQNQAKPEQ